jgi:chemotaxis protein methyltransferase CheR
MNISRFYRDAAVFEELARSHLPRIAARAREEGRQCVTAWSAGCASGEEAYSLALLWRFDISPAHPELQLDILASDADERALERARCACYSRATLRELPASVRERAFEVEGKSLRLADSIRQSVRFECRDLHSVPDARFDVVFCRNTAFTYFDSALQQQLAERSCSALVAGGVLVIGVRESLPDSAAARWLNPFPGIHVKLS